MVVGIGILVASVATGGAATPAAVAYAGLLSEGTATAATAIGAAVGAGSAAAGAAAVGAVSGVAGTVASSVATGAAITTSTIVGGAAGGMAAGAVQGMAAAEAAAVAGALGPVGWVILGCNDSKDSGAGRGETTWDCWKPIVHHMGNEPHGIVLANLLSHPRVKSKSCLPDGTWIVANEWDEEFNIYYVVLSDGTLAAHAEQL